VSSGANTETPSIVAASGTTRWSGTKMSSATTELLPVARMPTCVQVCSTR